jgi:hypothetical protein
MSDTAVLCAGDLIDDHDIAQALFGRIEYTASMSSDRVSGRLLSGGLWHDGDGPRYSAVSAVLTASNLGPKSVAAVEPCLWLNPVAANPIETASLPWRLRRRCSRSFDVCICAVADQCGPEVQASLTSLNVGSKRGFRPVSSTAENTATYSQKRLFITPVCRTGVLRRM